MDIGDSPKALHSFVQMTAPNDVITIYDGNFRLRSDLITVDGAGSLELRWFPRVQLVAEFEADYAGPFEVGELVAVETVDGSATLEHPSLTSQVHTEGGMRFQVRAHAIEFGTSDALDELTLHIVNFPAMSGEYIRDSDASRVWTGRNEFVAHGWRFTLDAISNRNEVIDLLNGTGGFAITHTCLVRREDEGRFSYTDVRDEFTGLGFLLAVVRGAWSSDILLVGTQNGQKVWERWDALGRCDQWVPMRMWWHPTTRDILQQLAPQVFDAVVGDDDSAARYAITWYTEARRLESSVESPLILSQTGLELLAWHIAVRRERSFSPVGFDRLRAEDRLRYLFSLARIGPSFPSGLAELQEFATEKGIVDIAHAICHVRNSVVHPPRKHGPIERVPVEIRIDVSLLAAWALEMCLLYLFEYRGEFANQWRDFHPPERVPWS